MKKIYLCPQFHTRIIQVCLIVVLLSLSIVPLGAAKSPTTTPATIKSLYASTYYVREGATGAQDGSDWDNAFPALPDPLERGAIYYLADGEYPDYTFDDAESDELYITIKKATLSEHGTDDGWQDAYGNEFALFHYLYIKTSYWVIDGAHRTSKDSGHGIKIVILGDQGGTVQEHGITVKGTITGTRINNITIKYVEFTSAIGEYPEGWIDSRGWERWAAKNGYEHTNGGDNVYIGYSYFHHFIGPMQRMRSMNGVVVEHNYYQDNKNYHGGPHGDAIQLAGGADALNTSSSTNSVIRYNEFADIEGTAFINQFWGVSNMHIYGNVFYFNPGMPQKGVSPGAIYAYDWDVGPMYVYNNTFVNSPDSKMGIRLGSDAVLIGDERYAYNNLWFNCTAKNAVGIAYEHEGYNYFSQSNLSWSYEPDPTNQITDVDPFIDSTSNNFHLQTILPGKDLSQESWWDPQYDSPYDRDGHVRGEDNGWDIGAYEFAPDLDLHGTSGNKTIYLDWTINITIPETTTWYIEYYTQTTTSPYTATDSSNTARSAVLTDNVVNGQTYTVTLSAMLDETPLLSDTVQVTPTRFRFVYLPLVLR